MSLDMNVQFKIFVKLLPILPSVCQFLYINWKFVKSYIHINDIELHEFMHITWMSVIRIHHKWETQMIGRLVTLKIDLTLLFLLQNDLLLLFQPFGVITKLMVLRSKNQVFWNESLGFAQTLTNRTHRWIVSSFLQALLQMQNIPSAIRAVEFYANAQPSIR